MVYPEALATERLSSIWNGRQRSVSAILKIADTEPSMHDWTAWWQFEEKTRPISQLLSPGFDRIKEQLLSIGILTLRFTSLRALTYLITHMGLHRSY